LDRISWVDLLIMSGNDRNFGSDNDNISGSLSNEMPYSSNNNNNYMEDGERDSPVLRDSSERPILKLSVRLIETYKNINKVTMYIYIYIYLIPLLYLYQYLLIMFAYMC
jgi:hypothetical protein